MRFWTKSLMARLVSYFLLLSLVALSLTGYLSYLQAREALKQSIVDRLNAVVTLKEGELNRWVNDQLQDVVLLAQSPEVRAQAQALLGPAESEAAFQAAYDFLAQHLTATMDVRTDMEEIFILTDIGGRVVLSTNKTQEGQYRVTDQYFTKGRLDTFVQNVYPSPVTGKPTMTISTPLLDQTGQRQGVLAAHLNLERLDQIILERTGLGTSGETYLIDRFNVFVSEARYGEQEFPRGVHTEGIDAALRGESSFGLYLNYREVPVIGVYRWLEGQDLALLAELHQREAFASARGLGVTVFLVGFASAAVLTLGVYLLARQIAGPILAIANTATQVAAGELDLTVPILTQDEVGTLAQAFNQMTGQLRDLIANLEEKVAERTRELEATATALAARGQELEITLIELRKREAELEESVRLQREARQRQEESNRELQAANEALKRRSAQLQAISEVGRAITQLHDPGQLLPQVTQFISQYFGFYHVGIFLIDQVGRNAVLRAANSPGGQRMLARGHRLKVGGRSIVGYVTSKGQPRIALDVGVDAVHFDNPDLPETRSEMAFPLWRGDAIVGALDVQSTESAAFDEQDVVVLQTLADQVSIALENAELFTQTQAAVAEAEAINRRYLQQEWGRYVQQVADPSYEYLLSGREYLAGQPLPAGDEALIKDDTVILAAGGDDQGAALAVPIKLRGQIIGVLDLQEADENRDWTEDEIALVEAIAEQLGLALENTRLVEQTQARARRETLVRRITERIRDAADVDAMLQVAVQELGRALGAPRVYVRLGVDADQEEARMSPVAPPADPDGDGANGGQGGR